MAASREENYLRRANFRLCRLCVWPTYSGLGFNLKKAFIPPHSIRIVESNSPAAAGGLKILDLILAVNNQDASAANYKTVTQTIINARDSNTRIDLLVIEQCYYEPLKLQGISFNPRLARIIEAPATMPRDYMNFPKYTPRTCEIRLSKIDESFGFEVSDGHRDIGVFIQEVFPDTPASRTSLRKSDRILEINDKFVDNKTNRSILNKLAKTKKKRSVKLYVVDTNTYKYFQENQIPLTPKEFRNSRFDKQRQQQQQQLQQNLDTNDNRQKVHNNDNNKEIDSRRTNVSIERSRNLYTPIKKDVVSDSDDRDVSSDDEPTLGAIRRSSLSESETSDYVINLLPSDPTAFEASLSRKRQEVIDNMSYRQAINSWNAKQLDDVVKLIIDLSRGKGLIDRAWIVFYWVSQNIEYDVEAYFSGNIRRQTPEDVFASGKGVCDAFGTIFETLCTAVQIECKKISGYAKGYSFKMGQKSFARTNHAWNVIRLEGHWYLVDPTWGEGFLDSNNCNRKKLDPFYFLVRPEQMIYRHLPEDSKWQLLMSPISMDDFVRLPFVYPTFFKHNLDVIYPRDSNIASFNSNLGLAEVRVRTPSDTALMGNIEKTESGKIKNGCLIQYDTNRQQWQCLFAPQQGGFHTLMLFARREKQAIKSETDDKEYSCAIQFGLHVPTDVIKAKTFPLTYGLFTERKCQIFEPLDGVLKSGSTVTIHCRIPGAYCARLLLDENWLPEDLIKDGIFKRQITVPKQKVIIYVQFSDKQDSSSYNGLFYYSVK